MSWQQWRLDIEPDKQELTEALLFEHGALSATLQSASDELVLEPNPGEVRLWQQLQLIALFEADTDINLLETNLAQHPLWPGTLKSSWEVVADQAWERAWMADYHPMQFGKRLWICPSWAEPPEPDAVNLMLDPGLAFGSGTHPTTALCLNFLDRVIKGNERVIDYGCGSGILGLAALKLGAKHVAGVDHDPQAILASQANLETNDLSKDSLTVFLPEDFPGDQGDIVVANILAETLIELVEEIVKLIKPGAWLAMSGILESQLNAVQAVYSPWIDFEEPELQEEWGLLFGKRKPFD